MPPVGIPVLYDGAVAHPDNVTKISATPSAMNPVLIGDSPLCNEFAFIVHLLLQRPQVPKGLVQVVPCGNIKH